MKTWFDMSIRIWWLLQGIILLVFGFFVWTPISVTGILVIICDCLYDNRNHKVLVLSRIMLMICALACMIYLCLYVNSRWLATNMVCRRSGNCWNCQCDTEH